MVTIFLPFFWLVVMVNSASLPPWGGVMQAKGDVRKAFRPKPSRTRQTVRAHLLGSLVRLHHSLATTLGLLLLFLFPFSFC